MDEHSSSLDEQSDAQDPPANEEGVREESPVAVTDDSDTKQSDETAVEESAEEVAEDQVKEVAPPKKAPAATSPQEEPETDDPGQMEWFVLKVQSNREKSIRESLMRRIKREGLEDDFGEVIIPTEKVKETKGGKTRVMERKLYPGYIMIQMILNDESWYLVRDTSGVGDFTGAAGKPIPMREDEISRMLGRQDQAEAEPAKIKIDLATGDAVKIKEGTFESFEGSIDAIDEEHGKITVLIEIFGRSTPVELEHWQVEKV